MPGILLDQNIPRDLRHLLPGHDVRHAADMGWSELTNGDLMTAGETAGFAVLITADQNLEYQQNPRNRGIAINLLSTNRWPDLQAGATRILQALAACAAASFTEVAFDRPRLRRRPAPKRDPTA